MMNVWDILKSPVVTEKAVFSRKIRPSEDGDESGQVLTFKVAEKPTKSDIKKAVEEIFNVKVAQVRTVHYERQMKRRGRQRRTRASFKKKAYVTLKKGRADVDYARSDLVEFEIWDCRFWIKRIIDRQALEG